MDRNLLVRVLHGMLIPYDRIMGESRCGLYPAFVFARDIVRGTLLGLRSAVIETTGHCATSIPHCFPDKSIL